MPTDYAYFDSGAPKQEPLSVSNALSLAKVALESITLSIVGEISDLSDNARYKAVYFTLADAGAALPCLMWRSTFDRLGIQLKSGMQVEVRGRFSLYSAKGRMQFEVTQMSLAGEGQLRAQVAALANKLRAQGLMDAAQKPAIPRLPQTIALITSPQGKAVHDVLRTLKRRFPLAKVLLFGVKVEGRDAALGLMQALSAAQNSLAEVILLVRGGGSYEDLMPFNDEALAMAIARSQKPIITGIGHEPDTSIADMVASLRASTPTAAAEAAVPNTQELVATLDTRLASLNLGATRYLERNRHALEGLERSAVFTRYDALTAQYVLSLEQTALRLDGALPAGLTAARASLKDATQRLQSAASAQVGERSHTLQRIRQALLHAGSTITGIHNTTLATAAASLESLSPLAVLARGYALSYDERGGLLSSVDEVYPGQLIKIRMADGSINARIESKEKAASSSQATNE